MIDTPADNSKIRLKLKKIQNTLFLELSMTQMYKGRVGLFVSTLKHPPFLADSCIIIIYRSTSIWHVKICTCLLYGCNWE